MPGVLGTCKVNQQGGGTGEDDATATQTGLLIIIFFFIFFFKEEKYPSSFNYRQCEHAVVAVTIIETFFFFI